jgi:hypothetical protein
MLSAAKFSSTLGRSCKEVKIMNAESICHAKKVRTFELQPQGLRKVGARELTASGDRPITTVLRCSTTLRALTRSQRQCIHSSIYDL